jgi:2-iminobutanoate/2-iminopropanoate deaminase
MMSLALQKSSTQLDKTLMKKKVISTVQGPSAIGPYSQAIQTGNLLFVSGQIPIDPSTGSLIEDSSIQAQTRRVLQNLTAIVQAAGGTVQSIVRTTVFLKDMADFAEMNAVYASFFTTEPPARSTVQAARLPRDVSIEIDCIAVIEQV